MLQRYSGRLALLILAGAANAAAQSGNLGDAPRSGEPATGTYAPQPQPAYAPQPQPQPAYAPQPQPGAPAQTAPQAPQAAPYPTAAAPTQPMNNTTYGAATYPTNTNPSGYDNTYAAQPNRVEPPPSESKEHFELPTMSIRIDPLNWLLSGRLGLELESQVWKFISVQFVPMFIVNDQPPVLNLNLSGIPNTLYQKSGGIGALAGTSVGVGFWLNGKPMEGYVLRAELTDYVIDYDTRDRDGPIDHVEYVDRAFQVLIGSHSKWGPVTLAGTFGLGSVLSKQNRCIDEFGTVSTSGCANNKELSIRVTRATSPVEVINLHEWTYPIVLVFRISLGVVF